MLTWTSNFFSSKLLAWKFTIRSIRLGAPNQRQQSQAKIKHPLPLPCKRSRYDGGDQGTVPEFIAESILPNHYSRLFTTTTTRDTELLLALPKGLREDTTDEQSTVASNPQNCSCASKKLSTSCRGLTRYNVCN